MQRKYKFVPFQCKIFTFVLFLWSITEFFNKAGGGNIMFILRKNIFIKILQFYYCFFNFHTIIIQNGVLGGLININWHFVDSYTLD